MAAVYCALILDSDYWDGTVSWGGETSEANRDAKYTAQYTSITAWETARDGASGAGDTEYLIISGPWVDADAGNLLIKTWTAGVVAIRIECPIALPDGANPARHAGAYSATCYRQSGGTTAEIQIQDDPAIVIDGVQVIKTTAGRAYYPATTAIGGATIKNCIFRGYAGAGQCIDLISHDSNFNLINCIIYDEWDYGVYGDAGGNTVNIVNCCIETNNHGVGIRDTGAILNVYNSAVFNNSDDFLNGVDVIENCASDDGDGTNPEQPTWANVFTNWDAGDFSLLNYTGPGDHLIAQGGDDPLGDSTADPDIAGTARSSVWDIGVFEYVAVGGSNAPTGVIYGPLVGPMGGPI